MKELVLIQGKLNAPKSQRNRFGNYNYRSAEDILEALKPHLKEHGCFVNISDTIELIGDRYYVKATAKITNSEGVSVEATAYAREEVSKKGMDASQITGSTSSYARKYALNGLFAIDDGKDADDNSYPRESKKTPKQEAPKGIDAEALAKMQEDIKLVTNKDAFKYFTEKYAKYKDEQQFRDLCKPVWSKIK